MTDHSSGRNEFNAGSDSAKHHGKGTATAQYGSATKPGPAVPTTGPAGAVRDQRPTGTPGSAVK